MKLQRILDAIARVNATEKNLPYSLTPYKATAITDAASMFDQHIKEILDLGGLPYSKDVLSDMGFNVRIENLKIGCEMHDWEPNRTFDGVFCRHVLEHSPFPLYMLISIHEWLKEGGQAIIVVPKAESDFVFNHPSHVSVLPKEQWLRLFGFAGFDVLVQEDGTWTKEGHVEHRFLLNKV